MACVCKYCGRPTDCKGDTCEICECQPLPSHLIHIENGEVNYAITSKQRDIHNLS